MIRAAFIDFSYLAEYTDKKNELQEEVTSLVTSDDAEVIQASQSLPSQRIREEIQKIQTQSER